VTGTPRFWSVVAGLAFLHFVLHLALGLGRWAPDLLTVSLLLGVRELRAGWAAGLGFFYGVLKDAFSILSFGAETVSMTVVGIVGARTRDLFVGDSILFVVSYLAGGVWLRALLHWTFMGELVRPPFVDAVLVKAPLGALYAALVGLLALVMGGGWARESAR